MKILLTGTAGFIGFHTLNKLIKDGHEVVGLDSINDYYDVRLKYDRLKECGINTDNIEYNRLTASNTMPAYRFIKLNLEGRENLHNLMKNEKFDKVCNLAAQAGVRYSIENPYAYIDSNITGFINIIEGCRNFGANHLIYASSSSVYGKNSVQPFSTAHNVDHPMSLYAATKKANELIAHTYSHLYKIGTTGLRFFTVYGPWGRPDMAMFKFADLMRQGKPIDVYNFGEMERDFTYVDDIVEGVCRVIYKDQQGNPLWDSSAPDPGSSSDPYKVYNIGNNKPVQLLYMIETLEKELGIKAVKNLMPLQPGDVHKTFADVDDLIRDHGYKPSTSIEEGISKFVHWYKNYYNL
ncbi:NAD-dependent epimerase [Seleniivibrio woodruffii]|uniref:UDP-glucuronate 4-epimerase n=1 Tax=Seleniivibrio woodruffii TaxID=1078050 RepID=A0A4R1KCX0_9BACT|nr:NAD-dependent epimerase [Seleniivibrio woodruffii]TCK62364.1 UDP-glucuronate 4-epimerase [Seleniivibrio woodruffii]TVZ34519.1 UDP-glucuronate 4-epimerase [Seleniivibrio woodruffii]